MDRLERRRIVKRPRLLRVLDETDAQIILLVGPAGYGKSTLARQWLRQQPQAIWCRATDVSNDVVALAQSVRDAAGRLGTLGRSLDRRIAAPGLPEPSGAEVAKLLASDLRALAKSAVLGVDDYHAITDPDADQLLPELADLLGLRLLVTSRRRPRWASGRRTVYGEILVLDQGQLSFSADETAIVLGGEFDGRASLHSLSRGWPAVIGLAYHTRHVPEPDALPEALFEFFAEEMYRAAEPRLQEALIVSSTSPKIDVEFLEHFFDAEASNIASEAVAHGFFVEDPHEGIELHPLLRGFLRSKLETDDRLRVAETAERSAYFFLNDCQWDRAFWVVQNFGRWGLLDQLIEGGLDDSLGRGRLKTLDRWLEAAEKHEVSTPVIDLARAELAFRRADQARAKRFAVRATSGLGVHHPRYSSAWYRRGQIAHFDADYETAIRAYETAMGATDSVQRRRAALWGLFTVVAESAGEPAVHYLEAYESAGELTIDDELRLANAKLILAHQQGGLIEASEAGRGLLPLVRAARDPLVQSSFLNGLAHGLLQAGEYELGLEVARRELSYAQTHHLAFVIPHGLAIKSGCEIGLRQFDRAGSTLTLAQEHLVRRPDRFAGANCKVVRVRLLLAQGLLVDAERIARQALEEPSGTAVDDEMVSLRALVLAARGLPEAAGKFLPPRPRVRNVETEASLVWARVACNPERSDSDTTSAFERSLDLGAVDAFVTAYRALPELLPPLLTAGPEHARAAADVLRRAKDDDLIGAALRAGEVGSALASLSPREEEVLRLVRDGLSNREIANVLFISEVTAKVHVRHILEKLRVRSRTEAAVLAARRLS